jgi:hypothetical protein
MSVSIGERERNDVGPRGRYRIGVDSTRLPIWIDAAGIIKMCDRNNPMRFAFTYK